MHMGNGVKVGPFEEFDLWVDALLVHQRQKRIPALKGEPREENYNYRDDLRTTLQLLKNLTSLPYQAIENQLNDNGPVSSGQFDVRSILGEPVRTTSEEKALLRDLSRFKTALEKYKTVCLSLIRVRFVSRPQFEAFSFLLAREIRSYKRSRGRRKLGRRLRDQPLQYLVQRHVLSHLEAGGVREQLEAILTRFLKLLTNLEYLREEMKIVFQQQAFLLILTCFYYSSRKLIGLLVESQEYLRHFRQEWSTGVACTAAALKLETHKAFDQEILDIVDVADSELEFGDVDKVIGILHNAFQESFIALAKTINPVFNEFALFDNLYRHYEESMRLVHSLDSFYTLVHEPAAVDEEEKWQEVLKEMEDFRSSSMRYLFSRDWKAFEEFSEELKTTVDEEERAHVLHRLEVYLSTLLGEVRKRSIFSKFAETPPGSGEPSREASSTAINW
ncbi:MAG TPA: hypothetical protein VKZ59_00100 [Acidobacteriota bacterium]|nr:hypothetical protein [Acidobacteriota bacterium]